MSTKSDGAQWNGKIQKILLVCRSSSQSSYRPAGEHEQRCAEGNQETYMRDWLAKYMQGPVDVRVVTISEQENSDQSAIEQAFNALEEHSFDHLLVASLDRISRGLDVLRFLLAATQQQMRIVSIADGIDTRDVNWLAAALAAMCDSWATTDAAGRICHQCS
jgi:DNA invertase Pin-like site-specific DNA recombinase